MRLLGATLGLTFVLAVAFARPANADGVDRTYSVGDEPRAIAVDPTDGRIYVANTSSRPGFISVIDPGTGAVTSHSTHGTPSSLALDPAHRRLYVSTFDSVLDVFDVTTMAIVATLPADGIGVAVDTTTERVYVVGSPGLTVIDGVTNTVVATTPASPDEQWFSVALDTSLHRVYVTNAFTISYPDGTSVPPSLIVLDDRDLSIVAELPLQVQVHWALAVDDMSDRVYVAGSSWDSSTGSYTQRLLAFDGVSLDPLGAVDLAGHPIGMAIGAGRIYVTSSIGGYHVVDLETLAVLQSFTTLPLRPILAALDAQGRLLFGAGGTGDDVLVAVSTGNHAPQVQTSSLIPEAPTTGEPLTYNVSAVDGDFARYPGDQRDPVTLTYEWARNGALIPGETTSTLDLSRAGFGDRGDTITATVTASDPAGLTATASASVVIVNTPPAVAVSLSSATPATDDVLVVSASASDLDGDTVNVAYEWSRNGVVIPGEVTASLDLAAHGDDGDSIAVRVTASDGHGGVRVATAAAFVLPRSGTFLYLNSQPGDYIGGGAQELYTASDSFIDGSLPQGGTTFDARVVQGNYVDWWYVTLAAPIGQPLTVGSYTGAVRAAFRPAGTPGLDISGNGRGCNTLTGRFEVTALSFAPYGDLSLLDATFEQHCEGGSAALFGRIRLEIPPPTPGVTLPPGTMTVPTSGTFLYMNKPNTSGGTYEQLYTSADSTFNESLPQGGNLFQSSVIQGNYVHWWYVDIGAPLGQPLAEGSYIRAVRAVSRTADQPGLDVRGDGSGCNTIEGKFDIDELTYAPSGELLVFQATFEQWCDASFTALYGRIRIENAPPVPPLVLGVTISEDGSVNSKSGVATISGTVSCSRAATIEVSGTLTQQVTKRLTVVAAFSTTVLCDAPSGSWTSSVAGENGRFGPGQATVALTATACEPQCVYVDATRVARLNSSK